MAFPSIPGLPDMTSGDKSRSEAQEDSGGLDQDPTTAQNQSGLPGGPLRTAESESADQDSSQEGGLVDQRSGDERLSGSKDGAESGKDLGRLPSVGVGEQPQGGQERKAGENSGAGLLGEQSQNTPETDGWVLSNELPETEKVRPGIPEVDDVDQVDESGIAETDKELEETLAGIDGSIMSDREEYTSKVNKRAGGMELPGDVVASSASNINDGRDQGTESGGTSTTAIPNPTYPGRHSQQVPEKPNPAPIGAADIPDAKDDDVVARQLREAALAETDPNLRAALWDELRRYLNKRK